MFDQYLKKWNLVPDGEPIISHSSNLLPVRQNGIAAMLKIAVEPEEKFGGGLMVWWNAQGAAQVLAHDYDALLLERAQGPSSLADLSTSGQDEKATRILCEAIAKLHCPREKPAPAAVPLTRWFADLFPAAQQHGGLLKVCASTARELLDNPQDERILHGDIHHGNILDFGARGWLAIDPKRLYGERGFDYANIFCNPDKAIASDQKLFLRRLDIITEIAELDRKRLLQWIVAWVGLSAVWSIGYGEAVELNLTVAQLAADELGSNGH